MILEFVAWVHSNRIMDNQDLIPSAMPTSVRFYASGYDVWNVLNV